MNQINLLTTITRNDQVFSKDTEGEIVMTNVATGNYYHLGKTAGVIWNILDKPITVEAVIKSLQEKFVVPRAQCEEETLVFINELLNEGLINIV